MSQKQQLGKGFIPLTVLPVLFCDHITLQLLRLCGGRQVMPRRRGESQKDQGRDVQMSCRAMAGGGVGNGQDTFPWQR